MKTQSPETVSEAPISVEGLSPTLDALLSYAKSAGAEQCDAVATHGRSISVAVRERELDVDSSEGRDVGLRVIVDGRQADRKSVV